MVKQKPLHINWDPTAEDETHAVMHMIRQILSVLFALNEVILRAIIEAKMEKCFKKKQVIDI